MAFPEPDPLEEQNPNATLEDDIPAADPPEGSEALAVQESFSADELLPDEPPVPAQTMEDAKLKAVLEAIIYVTDAGRFRSSRSVRRSSSRATG